MELFDSCCGWNPSMITILNFIRILAIVILSVSLCVSVVGLRGALNNKPVWIVKFYLAVQWIGLMACVVLEVALLIHGPFTEHREHAFSQRMFLRKDISRPAPAQIVAMSQIQFAVVASFAYYFFIVLLSYYKQIRRESRI